ncbi:hypothetical protein ACFXNW_18400 [Nocardia sp. NPDC059180]|uniref:hypothetical protein n=1 Tax=Nocardia sp. NPDC059180 TaxID=3346761 RepID=UPI00369C2078
MTDEDRSQVFRPLIEQARTGEVSLAVDPATFLALDRAMLQRKNEIFDIMQVIRKVAEQESWGLGEKSPHLTSAQTIVERFRGKAMNGPNNAYDVLKGHLQIANDMQTLFRTIRERLESTDSEFAAAFRAAAAAHQPETGSPR